MPFMTFRRLIAREGLFALLLIFGVGFLLFASHQANLSIELTDKIHAGLNFQPVLDQRHTYMVRSAIFHQIGFWLVTGYLVISLIRFLSWAIRTLRTTGKTEDNH